jgi:hypothetical protein
MKQDRCEREANHMTLSRKVRLGFLCLALAGCATATKPVAPAPAPAPAVVIAPVAKPAPAPVKAPAPKKLVDESTRPSIAATKTVAFDANIFMAKAHAANKGQVLAQYYLANEAPDSWTRLVELHVYPLAGKGIAPADYAQAMGKQAQQANPSVHYLVYPNKADGSVILDYLTWNDADLKASRLELNIFKFYTDAVTGNLISFHYAERVKLDPKASSVDNGKKVPAVRQRILPQIAATALYRE